MYKILMKMRFGKLTALTNIRCYGRWKTTFGGRRPSLEDNLRWKMTFGGRRLLLEDNLRWKTTYCGRRHLVEDDLLWSTTFSGRRPSLDPYVLPTPLCGIFEFGVLFGLVLPILCPDPNQKPIHVQCIFNNINPL